MPERTALYRYLADDGHPLYIGITGNVKERREAHSHQPWHREAASFVVEWHDSAADAAAAEIRAIKAELPTYNRAHNFGDITLDDMAWPSLAKAHRTKAIQLAELMRIEIETGRWPVGHKLPGPRALAAAVDIGWCTARQAIEKLVDARYVYLRRGFGHFVRQRRLL
ncbi:Bacterial regulatory protein, GntR family [Streptomyces sp. YIM 121038]|uniref:GntR family transcriptional regulator n=1 Tax=Streptomyces sp. YIM 121038 TaxID=2136401 RepID=UPI001110BFB3|nr:GntR family transcriptional regulator [Streptomyces sp. YIM 121038]QCX81218.1 Bacterial regulatory protein, GntR family [Streptomyces sp. YIM 121038]